MNRKTNISPGLPAAIARSIWSAGISLLIAAVLSTSPHAHGQSQSVSARLVLSPVLSSFVSDWERNPSQITLMVSNIGQKALDAVITVQLQGSRSGLSMTSTGRAIQLRAGSNVLLVRDIVDFAAIRFSGSDKEALGISRRLPDDHWELCVSISINELNQEIPVCENFVLQFAVAPSLLHPADEAEVSTRFPVFQWNTASMKSGVRILYRLRIVELQSGQSPEQAMNSNPAVFMHDAIPIPTYVYPVSAEPLKIGTRYVWQVQAVDEYGTPLGDNNGNSEIRQFIYLHGGME